MKRELFVGGVGIGGGHPVSIQSMTKTPTSDAAATLRQIRGLSREGCQIVRVALSDHDALPAFRQIVARSSLPVIADVHFDSRLAMLAVESGASGLRINPGNIGGNEKLKGILRLAGQRQVPIRIGANSGSIAKAYAADPSLSKAEKLVRSVLDRVKYFEDQGFFLIKLSLKSSTVRDTVAAYREIDRRCDYPLHLGITEAGPGLAAVVKSAIGVGALLLEGIGNTIRVSLTAPPRLEVRVAKEILTALELRRGGIEIVSCPTCSRTSVDLLRKVGEVSRLLRGLAVTGTLRVAIMGCEVNGPGEAAGADVGLAFSRGTGYLFAKGNMLGKTDEKSAPQALLELIQKRAEVRRIGSGREAEREGKRKNSVIDKDES